MSQDSVDWGPEFTATQIESIDSLENEASLQNVEWSPDFTASQLREIDLLESTAVEQVSNITSRTTTTANNIKSNCPGRNQRVLYCSNPIVIIFFICHSVNGKRRSQSSQICRPGQMIRTHRSCVEWLRPHIPDVLFGQRLFQKLHHRLRIHRSTG